MKRKPIPAHHAVTFPLQVNLPLEVDCAIRAERNDQIWRVIPKSTPKILKRCPRCEENKRFSSSDKFRVNANKKIIDVWLIYKCEICDDTFNVPIVSRKSVSKINKDLFKKFLENDRELAWQYAFSVGQMLKGAQLDWEIVFEIQSCDRDRNVRSDQHVQNVRNDENNRDIRSQALEGEESASIFINSDFRLKIPIHAILKQKLQCSRNQLKTWFECGGIEVTHLNGTKGDLKSFLGEGCILKILREIMTETSQAVIE